MIRCKGLLSLYALTCFRLYIDPYYSVLLRQNYGKYRRLNTFFRIVSNSKDHTFYTSLLFLRSLNDDLEKSRIEMNTSTNNRRVNRTAVRVFTTANGYYRLQNLFLSLYFPHQLNNTNNIQGMRICEKFSFYHYLSFYALIMAEMTFLKVSLISF